MSIASQAPAWLTSFHLQLPSRLRSKSNYRKNASGWGALATFESVTAAALAAARPADWHLDSRDTPVAERHQAVMVVCASSLLDSANFTKSVADATEGVLVVTDASVTATATLSKRSKKDQLCLVGFAQLPPNATVVDQAAALSMLAMQVADEFAALTAAP